MKKKHGITRREAIGTIGAGFASPLFLNGGLAESLDKEGPVTAVDYSLQSKISGLQVPDVISVVGCGGFGSWPALFAALSGVKKLVVFDPAQIDSLDLARTPYPASYLGKAKVTALRDLIVHLRPDVSVETHEQLFATKDFGLIQGPILFDGTNDPELGEALSKSAEQRKFRYVTGFYIGENVGVMNSYAGAPKFESGKNVPVWIGTAALSGILALNSAFHEPFSFLGSTRELNTSSQKMAKKLSALGAVGK